MFPIVSAVAWLSTASRGSKSSKRLIPYAQWNRWLVWFILSVVAARLSYVGFTLAFMCLHSLSTNRRRRRRKRNNRARRRNLNSIYTWHTHMHTQKVHFFAFLITSCVCLPSRFSLLPLLLRSFLLSLWLLFTLAHLCMRACACVLVLAWKAAHVCEFESFVCSARATHFISIRSVCATGSFFVSSSLISI